MVEIEFIAVVVSIFVGLAFFNLYLYLHLLNRKGGIINRIKKSKKKWSHLLPKQFLILSDKIIKQEITEEEAPDELLGILSTFFELDAIEFQYRGREKRSVVTNLLWNFFALIMSALFIIIAILINDIIGMVIIGAWGVVFLLVFLFCDNLPVINFIS